MIDSTCVFHAPEAGEPGAAIEFATEPRPRPPEFRFAYPDPHPWRRGIRVVPFGFAPLGLDGLRAPWRGVVGEVVIGGGGVATVRFAHLDGEQLGRARAALERWAREDRWSLTLDPAPRPLAEPTLPHRIHSGRSRCPSCGDERSTGAACHIGFGCRGWEPTGCVICGGRVRWWSPLDANR